MGVKFIAFDLDADTGWKLHAEGVHPDDLYDLINKIPGMGRAFFPYRPRPESRHEHPKRMAYEQPEVILSPTAPTPKPIKPGNLTELCAITPNGEIYSLQDVTLDPNARGTGVAIFWTDPDTGDLVRCKGRGFAGWPEGNRVIAEERFRVWAAEKGYEVSPVRNTGRSAA